MSGPTLPSGFTLEYGWQFDSDFTNSIPPPSMVGEGPGGSDILFGLQPTATVTSPNLSMTGGLSGVGGGMTVYLYAQAAQGRPYYGELDPLNGPDGKPAYAQTVLAAGSVTCASYGDAKSKSLRQFANGSVELH